MQMILKVFGYVSDKTGATATHYALIVALVCVGAVGGYDLFG